MQLYGLVNPPTFAERVHRIEPALLTGQKPHFNCSLIEFQGRTIFAYRQGQAGARIYLCELNADLQPGRSVMLDTGQRMTEDAVGQEDPRLFIHKNRLHCSYIGVESRKGRIHAHQCLATLSDDLRVEERWCPEFPGRDPIMEKNWGFFSWQDQLLAVRWICPHQVLQIVGGRANVMVETPGPWPGSGDVYRGGAPPVKHGSEYWNWFHGKLSRGHDSEYWIGLYTFEAEPPFAAKRMIRMPLLVPNHADRPRPNVPFVAFPCGSILRNGRWLVSYGYMDHECRIAEFDHRKIAAMLQRA